MNIGLVLSGGLTKGAYQVGALRALTEYLSPEDFSCYSCASVGALNGYSFVTHQLDRLEEMWYEICENKEKILITRLLKSQTLLADIEEVYQNAPPLTVPFYCSLLNLSKLNIVYQNLLNAQSPHHIPLFLKAGVSIPFYNRAVPVGEESYLDGGAVDNIPVHPLLNHELDYIVCFYYDDVCYRFENDAFDKKIIKIAFPVEGSLKQSLVLKRSEVKQMIESGYNCTKKVLSQAFKNGVHHLETIYNYIENANRQGNGDEHLRITGDVLITNINKITKKITKRKIQ